MVETALLVSVIAEAPLKDYNGSDIQGSRDGAKFDGQAAIQAQPSVFVNCSSIKLANPVSR